MSLKGSTLETFDEYEEDEHQSVISDDICDVYQDSEVDTSTPTSDNDIEFLDVNESDIKASRIPNLKKKKKYTTIVQEELDYVSE